MGIDSGYRLLAIEVVETAIRDAEIDPSKYDKKTDRINATQARDKAIKWLFGQDSEPRNTWCGYAGIAVERARKEAWERMKPRIRGRLRKDYGYVPDKYASAA